MNCNLIKVGILLIPVISFNLLAADSRIYDDGDERYNRQTYDKSKALYGKSNLKEEKCKSLAIDVSIGAFSPDTNGMLYTAYKLSKGQGAEYINKTRTTLEEKMVDHCKSIETWGSIEEFRDKFQGACSNECQEQSLIFKDPLIGTNSMKTNASVVCLSICNKTRDKLDMLIEGIELGKNLTKKESGDCGASVSDISRSDVKSKGLDAFKEKVKSLKAVQK